MKNCDQCSQEFLGEGNPVYDENFIKIIARICDTCYGIHLGVEEKGNTVPMTSIGWKEEEANTSKKSNNLNSHMPEKHSHRVDKMSGGLSGKFETTPTTRKQMKKDSNKKRRQLLKQNKEDKF